MHRRFAILFVAILILGSFLVFQATRSTAATAILPGDLKKLIHLERVRVVGRVSQLPIEYTTTPQISLRFSLENPGGGEDHIATVYHNLKPDMFAPGRDVIIDGTWNGQELTAKTLLTQCPSKYEPPSPNQVYSVPETK